MKSKTILALLIIFLPVLVLLGAWSGSKLSNSWPRMHATVRLAERVYQENQGLLQQTTDASSAFRATGQPVQELYDQATQIRKQFKYGGGLVGAFIGLVAGLKLIRPSIRVKRTEFTADRAGCFACGRCYRFCPREQVRLKNIRENKV